MDPLQQPFVDGGEYEASPHDHTLPSSWLCHPRHADSTTYGRLLVTWLDKRRRLGFRPLPSQRRERIVFRQGRTQTGIKLSAPAGNLCVEQAEGVFELLAILPEVAPEISKLFQARENRFHVESV